MPGRDAIVADHRDPPREPSDPGTSMNTRCPHCHTVFRLPKGALESARGRVRCGQCRRTFDARAHLQNELAFDGGAASGQSVAANGRGTTPQTALRFERPAQQRVSGVLLSDLDGERPPPRRRSTPSRRSIVAWAGINALLLAGLLVQLVHVQREAFAQNPSMRPLVADLCRVVGCTLEPRRAVDRIELVRRNVYAHPNVDDALIIDAKFVNNAPFPQPYPILTVSLGDLRGEPLIRRNFRPREYRPELDPNARMAPGSPVRVTLEVRDPGRDARTFELGFS